MKLKLIGVLSLVAMLSGCASMMNAFNQLNQAAVAQKDLRAQMEKDAGWIDTYQPDSSSSGKNPATNGIIPQKAMVLFVRPTTRASHRYSWSIQRGSELCRLGRAVSVPWDKVDVNTVSYTGGFTETGREASIDRNRDGVSWSFIQKTAYEGIELYGPASQCKGGPGKKCGNCDIVVTDAMKPGWNATTFIVVNEK